ncbi:hypothetical protein EVAR_93949_1 [Eumeta japonica]|uniref:Uncharacterized protein n=1 Tax=Eumeta variegata TaxID=151549 RepID=A0A4C1TP75_EUMVA|nr:hypothetical protein EVAR_93949_1 [Eumeta japonica]
MEKPKYDSIVVNARCTRVALDERILKMVEAITRSFKSGRDMVITITREAARDLRKKLASRLEADANSKVQTMTSVLINGFWGPNSYHPLTVGTIIARTMVKQKLHDSIPHVVVAPHRQMCNYTDDGEDAVDSFIKTAMAVSENKIKDHNAKMAIRNRHKALIEILMKR